MPAKKASTAAKTEKKAETAAEEKVVKKTTKKAASEEKAVKKTTKKAAAEEKTTAKKTTRKPAAKKAVKAEEPVQPEVVKQSVQKYKDVINWKKWEAHHMNWLYIEINAGDLMTEIEAGVDNLGTCCEAILACMLEGDGFIVEPKEENRVSSTLTVRYYCDNLSEDRRNYWDVNQ